MTAYTLKQDHLDAISEHISIPKYQRRQLKTGIVHIGIGDFHRGHQAYYTDQLLHDTSITDWGICGVALLPSDIKIYKALKKQDGLYTLMVKEFDGALTKRVIGSITEVLFAPENPSKVIKKMASSAVKIITLTITERGYNYNEVTKAFDDQNPNIRHDIANPLMPKTVFGYLTQALKLRKEKGAKGVTIQSCDNIQRNGHMAKNMLLSYVRLAEPSLVSWIETHVSFPNSMVDRITPTTTASDIAILKATTSIKDTCPVVCEPFKQWVIEDDFVNGRPLWDAVAARFVEDIVPYEKMKLSLLNAGHTVLGILGALLSYKTIDEAVHDEDLRTFLEQYMDHEVSPTLSDLKGVDLEHYKASLLQRFGNVSIKDQIDRICSESASKIPIFVLPTITANLESEGQIECAALLIAGFAIYSLGKNEQGKSLNIKDAMEATLRKKAAQAANGQPEAFLEIESVFGLLKSSPSFVSAYTKAYNTLRTSGVKACINTFINNRINC